jgi:hypothetical protein
MGLMSGCCGKWELAAAAAAAAAAVAEKLDRRMLSMEKASGLLTGGVVDDGAEEGMMAGRLAWAAAASWGNTAAGSGRLKKGRKRKGCGGSVGPAAPIAGLWN